MQASSKGKRLHYQSQERDRQDRTQGGGKRDLRGKDGVAVILVRQNRARAAGGHPRHQDTDIGQRRVQVERFEQYAQQKRVQDQPQAGVPQNRL